MKTWHYETAIVALILCSVTAVFKNDLVNWITTVAILFTFNHGQIGDRLQEKQKILDKPTVECYWKLNRLFVAKEIIWIVAFYSNEKLCSDRRKLSFCLIPLLEKIL
jgi:hypothetical protein